MDLEEPLARELSLEGLSVESVHHCRRTVTLAYTFGKLSFPEDRGLKDLRQKGMTFHVLAILNVYSVPQMCIDNEAHAYVSSKNQISKLTQSLPGDVMCQVTINCF